ncbi:DUF7352 domain-containing protein [Deinococcus multiflagellatus]|uniref:DUF7352 domain-containing protein n=1 Tax=Deinococcus multiflagellatus TaxID=1656887 RepID=A0ABW1ZQL2_9DEIO|nr:hypothetical protein [Deinococcus multiflagellatus]MBZ9715301.1 hypothetical protein [Deinococcus multiflagellatus]
MPDVIYKYPLSLLEPTELDLPDGEVTHVGAQNGQICLWIRHAQAAPATRRCTFMVVGTGQPFPTTMTSLGTVQMPPYVWHVGLLREQPL